MSSDEDFGLCGCSTEPPKQAKIFYRYVNDILRMVKVTDVERLLDMANALHRNLELTIEEEKECSIHPEKGRQTQVRVVHNNNVLP